MPKVPTNAQGTKYYLLLSATWDFVSPLFGHQEHFILKNCVGPNSRYRPDPGLWS